MIRKLLVIAFVLFLNLGFSQEKPKTVLHLQQEVEVRGDSIFVFERVRDTVYEIKEERLPPNGAIKKEKIDWKNSKKENQLGLQMRLLSNKIATTETVFNSGRIRDQIFDYQPIDQNIIFGLKTYLGKENNSFFKEFEISDKTIVGLGIWTRKQLFHSDFSFGLGIDAFFYTHNYSINQTGKPVKFNVFYYTDNGNPLVFESVKSNAYQLQVPFQVGFSPGRFVITAGGYMSYSEYTLGMYGAKNGVISYNEVQDFTAGVVQIGYTAEVQYYIFTHLSLGLLASHGGFENLTFTNNQGEIFTSINEFTETKGMIQLVYTF